MSRLLTMIARRLAVREEGATLVEYALALLLICVVTIAIIGLLGNAISGFFQNAANTI